jgi:ankyrin repeat protein
MASYDGWSKQELQEECTRRGLKTTGTKAVLVERLESNDELQVKLKAAVSHKRKAVSEEEQDALDEQLLDACEGGSLDAVRAALSSGANSSCVDEDLLSPLMLACCRQDDWAVAEDVVRELLSFGAAVNSCNDEGWMAIHYAARWSSCAVVTLLLKAKSRVDPRDEDNNTPLLCCERSDEEAVKIARVLLDRGAQVEHCGRRQRTSLLQASRSGSAELVELLLSRGADIKAVDENGDTALMLASCNGMHGPAIIPLLAKAGVDVNAVNSRGGSALVYGLDQNGFIMQALAPLYPQGRQLADFQPGTTCPDPIGCVREAAPFGCSISNVSFGSSVRKNDPTNYCWARLRLGGSTITKTFTAMEKCQDASLWRLVGLEMLTTRHPDNDSTLLHVAARTNNTNAVRELMAIWMNPLLRNREGRLAVELATDPIIRAELCEYAVHSLNREVLRWYGPYLRQRVRTFLLVVQRWGTTRVRWLPRDIVHMIIRRVMAVEYV